MIYIITMLIFFIIYLFVFSGITALASYVAAYFVKAENNIYIVSYVTVLKNYLLISVIAIVFGACHINSLFINCCVAIGLFGWLIYQLTRNLWIKGRSNIVFYSVFLFVINIVLFAIFKVL